MADSQGLDEDLLNLDYDTLTEEQQAKVRALWDKAIENQVASLDLTTEFRARGRSWTEATVDGEAIVVNPKEIKS